MIQYTIFYLYPSILHVVVLDHGSSRHQCVHRKSAAQYHGTDTSTHGYVERERLRDIASSLVALRLSCIADGLSRMLISVAGIGTVTLRGELREVMPTWL